MPKKRLTVVNNTPSALTLMPKWLQTLMQQTDLTDLTVTHDPESLFQTGIAALQGSTVSMMIAGWCFAEAKAEARYGDSWFREEAAKHNISIDTLYRAIRVYNFAKRWMNFCNRGKNSNPKGITLLSRLEYRKFLELRQLDDDDLERLFKGDEVHGISLDNLQDLSVRELGLLIKDGTFEARRLRNKLDDAVHTIDLKNREIKRLKLRHDWEGDLPPSVRDSREKATCLALESLDCITHMDAIQKNLLDGVDLTADDNDRRHTELRAGAAPLVANLSAIIAQATAVLHRMQSSFGERYLPKDAYPMLSEDECAQVMRDHSLMLSARNRLVEKEKKLARKKLPTGKKKTTRGRKS